MSGADAPDRGAAEAAERRREASRKLLARLCSIEAIVSADLRKRGNPALTQAADRWYAEAISAAATEATITRAARDVLALL